MKNLVIVESPSKSKTIEKYLGKDYKVTSSKGHIRDLSIHGKGGLGVDIENGFKPDYVVSPDKKEVVKELKKMVKEADFVYLATDPDREGEAISWHLAKELGLDLNENNRIVFNEITKSAVLKALQQPRTIDLALVSSQETRRILDRILGFKLSKLLQKKIGSKSAGRVQSIALRMVCDKEAEINAFVPKEYWTLKAILENGMSVQLVKYQNKKLEVNSKNQADEIISKLAQKYVLREALKKNKKRAPYLPLITSTLQQEASTKLGFTSKKTMMVAQGLYEGVEIATGYQGLITYMRSDSTRLSKEFVDAAFAKIENEYGKQYKGHYHFKNDESSQDAHEAIRPTNINNTPESLKPYLSNDQYKLYRLIYARALASLMADSVSSTLTYTFDNNGYSFNVSGSKMEFDGFLKVYGEYDNSKDVILPDIKEGECLKQKDFKSEQHFTEPPARYTEAKLIKALEEEGVGRPSTYATIIDTIQKRNYVEYRKGSDSGKTKYFFPTEQGLLTDEKLKEYFLDVINIEYTANMEKQLDLIAEDKMKSIDALTAFYNEFEPLLENANAKMEKKQPEMTDEICPLCGGNVLIKDGRYGKFKACINYPTCKWHAPLVKKEEPELIERTCPECGKPLLKRKSRYGTYFIGCSGYPNCHYMEPIEGEKPKKFYPRKGKK